MTTAFLTLAPEQNFRSAPLVPLDGSLAQFAREACESIAELGDLSDAALAVMSTTTDELQVLADHGDVGLGRSVTHDPIAQLIRAAADAQALAESPDQMLLATTASAGGLLVVVVGRRADDSRMNSGDLGHVLESAVRVLALSLRDRVRLIEAERRLHAQQQTRLACSLHDDVVQRLFGVSLILDADESLAPDLRAICATEVERALADLRKIISSPIGTEAGTSAMIGDQLRATLETLREQGAEVDAPFDDLAIAPAQQAIACSIVNEAVRNARKHAEPKRVQITVRQARGILHVSVFNDGVREEGSGRPSQRGVGLQLAATEAALGGGVLDRGPAGSDGWAVRLALPLEERDEYDHYAGTCAGGGSGG